MLQMVVRNLFRTAKACGPNIKIARPKLAADKILLGVGLGALVYNWSSATRSIEDK